MDKYELGHVHSDCNAFELWANNRAWFIDRGKFGGTIQEAQSGILVDGVGACSAKRNSWPSLPGKFIEYRENELAVIGCGDASFFYRWAKSPPPNGIIEEVKNHGFMWSDFYFPRDGEKMPEWMKYSPLTLDGYGKVHSLYRLNPVEKAFRTVVLVRGRYPFVLIADDFRKDDSPHRYTWFANVPYKNRIQVVAQDATSLILKHREDRHGPFLLINVLKANGLEKVRLNRDPNRLGKDTLLSERVEISTSRVTEPDFILLLYPFKQGAPMPTLRFEKNRVSVSIAHQVRSIWMKKDATGRTRLSVTDGTEAPAGF
ncbi:MAG: hypothetical protein D6820_16350 [Lentisphaerae bacterium]|nr:MAG: hypothetical protein D6820_16350 [Lentisphaerota bacterium]